MRLVEFAIRFLGALLALFIVANFVGTLVHPRFGADWIWVDLSEIPSPLATVAKLSLAAVLLAGAFVPPSRSPAWWFAAGTLAAFALATAADVRSYIDLVRAGAVSGSPVLSLSLLVCLYLLAALSLLFRADPRGIPSLASTPCWKWRLTYGLTAASLVAALPLAHLVTFGRTDYRRTANAAIVLGARVHPSGEPSDALRHRLRTALELYQEGRVPLLIMSGARGSEGWNEAEVMRDWAIDHGVPPERILVDPAGTSTEASVTNTTRILRERGLSDVLVVSHHFHNPRLKLAYSRAGVTAFTVPAREDPALRCTAYYMARECAAFLVYYLRPPRG